jgi:hypothetical protein
MLRFGIGRIVVGAIAAACSLLAPGVATAQTAQVVGPEATVWDWTSDRCSDGSYADQPARAFRNSSGQVTVTISSSQHNGRMLGPTLNTVVPDKHVSGIGCDTTLNPGPTELHPSKYRQNEWINSTYSFPDTNQVYALVHNEWHGSNPDYCSKSSPGDRIEYCHVASVTQIISNDGGDEYQPTATPPNHLAVTLPYRYVRDWGQHGWGELTNILFNQNDEYFYALAPVRSFVNKDQYPPPPGTYPAPNSTTAPTNTSGAFGAQKRGTCVIRTPFLGASSATWTTWDGDGFDKDFMNPYTSSDAPANHVCEPVDLPDGYTAESLTYSTYFGRFMAIVTEHLDNPGGPEPGIYYSLSDDMVHWDPPKLIVEKLTPARYAQAGCPGGQKPFSYPVVLDPLDTTANFDHPGQHPYLYYTQFNQPGGSQCQNQTSDRDLVRVPIRFSKERVATFEDNAINDPDTGYDAGNGALDLIGSSNTPPPYEGAKALRAIYWPNTDALGTINESFPNGSDVWYGSAFFLPGSGVPGTFPANNDNVTLMEWSNTSRSVHGGVALRASDNTFRVVRGTTSNPADDVNVTPEFSLPEGQWLWLEVHQKLDQANPLTEVFVNNQLVVASASQNNYPDSAGIASRIRFGFDANQSNAILGYLDRSSVGINQHPRPGGPPTPLGLSGTAFNQMVMLVWNASAGANGYVVYRQDSPNGIWVGRLQPSTTAAFDQNLAACHLYSYRVAARNSAGIHSAMSPPIPVTTGGC